MLLTEALLNGCSCLYLADSCALCFVGGSENDVAAIEREIRSAFENSSAPASAPSAESGYEKARRGGVIHMFERRTDDGGAKRANRIRDVVFGTNRHAIGRKSEGIDSQPYPNRTAGEIRSAYWSLGIVASKDVCGGPRICTGICAHAKCA
jgi:hypothetical protein